MLYRPSSLMTFSKSSFDSIPELYLLSEFSVPYLDHRLHQGRELSACLIIVHLPVFPITKEVVALIEVRRVSRFWEEVVIGISRVTSCGSSRGGVAGCYNRMPVTTHFSGYVFLEAFCAMSGSRFYGPLSIVALIEFCSCGRRGGGRGLRHNKEGKG